MSLSVVEITENKEIAIFMGYEQFEETGAWVNKQTAGYKFVLSYHDNWSEIMPVVEKIALEITIGKRQCINETIYLLSFYTKESIYTISDLWKAILAYIKFKNEYNAAKQKQP